MLELTRTRLSKDETMTRDEEGRGHEDGQNHPKMRRNRRRLMKLFIGILEGKIRRQVGTVEGAKGETGGGTELPNGYEKKQK